MDGKPDFRENHGCCRDFYCLIVFVACIIAVIVIFACGFKDGHPYDLIDPTYPPPPAIASGSNDDANKFYFYIFKFLDY